MSTTYPSNSPNSQHPKNTAFGAFQVHVVIRATRMTQ